MKEDCEAFIQVLVLCLKTTREIWAFRAICYIAHPPGSKKMCRQSCARVDECKFIKIQGFCSDPRLLLEKELFQMLLMEQRRGGQLNSLAL